MGRLNEHTAEKSFQHYDRCISREEAQVYPVFFQIRTCEIANVDHLHAAGFHNPVWPSVARPQIGRVALIRCFAQP